MIKDRKDFMNFIKEFPYIIDNRYKESFSKNGFLYTTNGKIMAKIKTDLLDGIYDNKIGELSYKKESNFTPTMAKEIIPEHKYLNLSFNSHYEEFKSAIEEGVDKETDLIELKVIDGKFKINGIKFCDAFYSRDIILNFTKDRFVLLPYLGNSLIVKIYDNYDFYFSTSPTTKIISHHPIVIEDEESNQLIISPLNP